MVPERTKSAAALFVIFARWDSRDAVVGSSMKTSSKRVAFWIAVSMEGVGVVTTSPSVFLGQILILYIYKQTEKESRKATHSGNRKQLAQGQPKHFVFCADHQRARILLCH